jgi:hypothetical protein
MADIPMVNQRDSMEGRLLPSQAVLPLQFYGPRRDALESEALKQLMSAMLIDAVRCFQTKFKRHQSGRRQEFAECNRGSSLAGMTGRSRFERCVMSWRLLPKLFDKRSPAGHWKKSPAGNLQRFSARRCSPSVFQVLISWTGGRPPLHA